MDLTALFLPYKYRILGGELFDRVICDDFILTERACVMFMRQICEGMAYMHTKHILHLDMKVSHQLPNLMYALFENISKGAVSRRNVPRIVYVTD